MPIDIIEADWATQQHQLLAVRYAVFVDEQGVPAELEHDAQDAEALHLLALNTERHPVATARMLNNGHIGRMAVLPAWRHQGIGTALLRKLLRHARRNGYPAVFLHAQCAAEGFYEHLGFHAEGEVFIDAGIDHRAMRLSLDTQ